MTGNRRAFFESLAGSRRTFLTATAAAGAVAALPAQTPLQPPNVVLIYCDDLGYGDLSCYGSQINTPNIDRMAADGMRFTHFTSAAPVCTPARAAVLTGRYPNRYGLPRVLDPSDSNGLPATETTIAQMLKGSGYSTMCIGKWHLGSKPEFLPTNHGFDNYYGLPYSADMAPLPLLQNQTVLEQPANLSNLTQRYTQQAVSYINGAAGSPFFLYFAHSFPHVPVTACTAFQNSSGQGIYGDVVREIDGSVGTILQTLRQNGIDSNTLVIFSSDHGPWYQGSTGGLRQRKGEIFEGGVRVPFVARFPGTIPAGVECDTLITSLDVLPTIAALTGASLPANPLDGISIMPLLSGQQTDLSRDAFLYFNDVELQAARLGDWKLHVTRFNSWMYSPDPPGGRLSLPLRNPELYNLAEDPQESCDRAMRNPQIVASIRARMDALIQTFPGGIIGAWTDTLSRPVNFSWPGALPISAPTG